jgi:hypothetical protein
MNSQKKVQHQFQLNQTHHEKHEEMPNKKHKIVSEGVP